MLDRERGEMGVHETRSARLATFRDLRQDPPVTIARRRDANVRTLEPRFHGRDGGNGAKRLLEDGGIRADSNEGQNRLQSNAHSLLPVEG